MTGLMSLPLSRSDPDGSGVNLNQFVLLFQEKEGKTQIEVKEEF